MINDKVYLKLLLELFCKTLPVETIELILEDVAPEEEFVVEPSIVMFDEAELISEVGITAVVSVLVGSDAAAIVVTP